MSWENLLFYAGLMSPVVVFFGGSYCVQLFTPNSSLARYLRDFQAFNASIIALFAAIMTAVAVLRGASFPVTAERERIQYERQIEEVRGAFLLLTGVNELAARMTEVAHDFTHLSDFKVPSVLTDNSILKSQDPVVVGTILNTVSVVRNVIVSLRTGVPNQSPGVNDVVLVPKGKDWEFAEFQVRVAKDVLITKSKISNKLRLEFYDSSYAAASAQWQQIDVLLEAAPDLPNGALEKQSAPE